MKVEAYRHPPQQLRFVGHKTVPANIASYPFVSNGDAPQLDRWSAARLKRSRERNRQVRS